MNTKTISFAGKTLNIVPNDGEGDHLETVLYDDEFMNRNIGLKIWETDHNPSRDAYQYETTSGAKYTHPTLSGARNMIAAHLLEAGIFQIPPKNDHLSNKNKLKLKRLSKARIDSYQNKPRVGDVVYINNIQHRIVSISKWGAQTFIGGSFCIADSGNASFSGCLDPSRLIECFKPRNELKPAKFWMWDAEKGVGGDNGVYIMLNTQSWEIVPHNLTEDQIINHPTILHYRKLFGEHTFCERDINIKIAKISQGFGG